MFRDEQEIKEELVATSLEEATEEATERGPRLLDEVEGAEGVDGVEGDSSFSSDGISLDERSLAEYASEALTISSQGKATLWSGAVFVSPVTPVTRSMSQVQMYLLEDFSLISKASHSCPLPHVSAAL